MFGFAAKKNPMNMLSSVLNLNNYFEIMHDDIKVNIQVT